MRWIENNPLVPFDELFQQKFLSFIFAKFLSK